MPRTFRPTRVLWLSVALSVVLVVGAAIGWVALPENVRVQFSIPQLVTLALFIAIMVAFMLAVGLSYVRVDDSGLQFRNGLVGGRLQWSEIAGFRYRSGDPWAYVNHTGPTGIRTRQLLGIQAVEGRAASEAVEYLRARLAEVTDSG